jgi:hypothetical protein
MCPMQMSTVGICLLEEADDLVLSGRFLSCMRFAYQLAAFFVSGLLTQAQLSAGPDGVRCEVS